MNPSGSQSARTDRTVWTKLSEERMELKAPCGCVQAFYITPQFEIYRSAVVSRCGSRLCEYRYVQLLSVALRLAACLRNERIWQSDPIPFRFPVCGVEELA
jgi:hypothetical protein